MAQGNEIRCTVEKSNSPYSCNLAITVPPKITESFFQLVTENHQELAHTIGFKKGTTPLSYIQKHFKGPILSHLKEISLKFFGIHSLLQNIRKQKIILVSQPKLRDIVIDEAGNIIYQFQAFAPKELYMQSWKYLPFKAIPRKKYRDIDKQVKSFLEEEQTRQKTYNPEKGIQVGDWVCFQAWLINKKNNRIFKNLQTNIWIRIGEEEPDLAIQQLFVNKKIGDSFITDNPTIQHYFCETSNNKYLYEVLIKDIVPTAYFSTDLFRQYFKIKTQKDMLAKLTEVFSFHHDISQRRLTAFEALNLIRRKNQVILPDSCIIAQKKDIIEEMQFRPDFMVYKMNPEFDKQLTNLAQKQLTDSVIAEHIGYQDNLIVNHDDVKAMLHLTQRPRVKDFIYFPFVKTQYNGQEIPINEELLLHFCLKEKAINHIIYHLTKK